MEGHEGRRQGKRLRKIMNPRQVKKVAGNVYFGNAVRKRFCGLPKRSAADLDQHRSYVIELRFVIDESPGFGKNAFCDFLRGRRAVFIDIIEDSLIAKFLAVGCCRFRCAVSLQQLGYVRTEAGSRGRTQIGCPETIRVEALCFRAQELLRLIAG
jgi:hypothetical protein